MEMTKVCTTEDVPSNGMKEVELEGKTILIVNSGDEYYAFNGICPHQEVRLCEGLFDGCVLTCHEHLWQWEVQNKGAPIGLAEAPLEYYDVKVENDEIYVGIPSALTLASIFEGISAESQTALSALARHETHEAGSTIYDVGDTVEDLYLLESGRVEFMLGREDRTSPGGFMIRKGELFGWAALVADQPRRIARATCKEDSTVIALNGEQVRKVLEDAPADGHRVMSNLVQLITRYLASFGGR